MAHEYELIEHEEGTAFRVFLISIDRRLHHWHGDVEVLLVLEGSVTLDTGGQRVLLQRGDVFVVNANDIHNLCRTKETNVLLALQFDPRFCRSYDPRVQRIRFTQWLLTEAENAAGWGAVRTALLTILVDSYRKEPGFQLKTMGTLNTLVYQLLTNLAWEDRDEGVLAAEEATNRRLKRILNHVQQNFTAKVSLKELAASENLDMYYLSHFIKNRLGIPFQSYVNKLRLERAVFLITNTKKKLIDICLECGFSDYRYLYRTFLAEYGCTPLQYRTEYRHPHPLYLDQGRDGQHRYLDPEKALQGILAGTETLASG